MNREKQTFRAGFLAAFCAFCLSMGCVFCPVTAFGLQVNAWALGLVGLTASMICTLLLCVFRPLYVFGAIAAAGAALVYALHSALLESFSGLLAGIFSQYVLAFHFSMPENLAAALEIGADAKLALGVLAVLLALCTVWTVLSRCTLAGVFLASAPFLVVCLVILQTEPATVPVLLVIGTLTLLTLTQKLRFDTTQSGHRLAIRLILPVLTFTALLAVIFPRQSYTRSSWSESLAPLVDQAAEKLAVFRKNAVTGQVEFVSPFTPSTLGSWPWDSSVTEVNLRRVGPQRKTGRHVMQVYSGYTAACHLRADSMAVYEDSRWQALKAADYETSGVSAGVLLSPDTQTLGLDAPDTLQIRTDMKSSIFYTPYRPVELPEGGEAVYDAYIKNPDQQTEYTIQYAYVEETADRNAQYEAFVHETYTQLPDDIRAELEPILTQAMAMSLSSSEAPSPQKTARSIAAYVSGSASYSLDTPRVPDGEDFALWFLRESDNGYCVHFATATVLLLRAANIPARYVTGYYFTTQAGQWTDVTEDDAHAWVEYYLDGYGWQVLDPTPTDRTASGSETPKETPEQPEQDPQQTTQPDAPSEPSQSEQNTSNAADTPQTTVQTPAGKTVLHTAWIVLLLALALCVWQVALTALRRAAFATGSNNKRAVLLWRHIEFLCKLKKEEPQEALRELALKARFSQHKLTKQELSMLQTFSDEQTKALLHQSAWPKKLWLKAGLALHEKSRW